MAAAGPGRDWHSVKAAALAALPASGTDGVKPPLQDAVRIRLLQGLPQDGVVALKDLKRGEWQGLWVDALVHRPLCGTRALWQEDSSAVWAQAPVAVMGGSNSLNPPTQSTEY